ncbi:Putative carbonic anhydrase [Septoria linicola]|uniref:Carbonic anhydrase n=1 Tax=Septoria linicola TaxID=215465 RepID=A0A9Q9AUL4_9PEZI|nr:putative carbonic anhydrase [Septoria linicola]USW52287.1 Putative carbonic anhydrase [Septoria linicola]
MPSTDAYLQCLAGNKAWAFDINSRDQDFFPTCSKGQAPQILWIGCADSRCPETTILQCKPGEVFTHRNIANIVNDTDISLLSIVQFAVFHLKVKHIVVAGHTCCGGVTASLANAKLDVLDIWLQPLRELREKFADELEAIDTVDRTTFLARKNVLAGMATLKRMPIVIDAIKERGLELHGVLYCLDKGVLEELSEAEDEKDNARRLQVYARR